MRSIFCAIVLAFTMLLSHANTAFSWNVTDGNGTLGLGVFAVEKEGAITISYSLKSGRPGSALRQGVQLSVIPWDAILAEKSYFKLRSEYFVASVVDEYGDAATLTAKLKPGKYIIIYGQWSGISHDNPNDPYFNIDISGSASFISKWAGDVSMHNPSRKRYIPGQWGAIGKISAIWSNKSVDFLNLYSVFPGAKTVSGFAGKNFKEN